jgi:hypothetical protein
MIIVVTAIDLYTKSDAIPIKPNNSPLGQKIAALTEPPWSGFHIKRLITKLFFILSPL